MSLEERIKTAELWYNSCKTLDISLMVQIGGAPLPDVITMAEQAEELQFESVLCLPELYFKPKTEEELVEYLKIVAKHCPTRPFLYYHIPMFTGGVCMSEINLSCLWTSH